MSLGRDLWFRRIGSVVVDISLELTGGLLGSYFGAMVAALVTAMKNGAPEQMEHSMKSGFGIGLAFWAISVSFVNRVLIQGLSRASIGKKLFHLELISSAEPLTWSTMIKRWIVSVGSLASGGAGYAYAFFNEENLTFHDLIANTDVVPIFEGSSIAVEYREDTRTFAELQQLMVLSNTQAERPMATVIAFPAVTGTDGVASKQTLADVINFETEADSEKKAA